MTSREPGAAVAVAARVCRELLSPRALVLAAALLAGGLALASLAAGPDPASTFRAAARATLAVPALLAAAALLALPGAWPAAAPFQGGFRHLRVLPLARPSAALAPLAGAAAALALLLGGAGWATGTALGAGWPAHAEAPPCRRVHFVDPAMVRATPGEAVGRGLHLLASGGDAAEFRLPHGVQADRIELVLEALLVGGEGAARLRLVLPDETHALPPLGPGPHRVGFPVPPERTPAEVRLERLSAQGPAVLLGAGSLRLREASPRSHAANGALAFLSFLPGWTACAALLTLLLPLLSPAGARLAALGLAALLPAAPPLAGGLRARELAEGWWIGAGGLLLGQGPAAGMLLACCLLGLVLPRHGRWRGGPGA